MRFSYVALSPEYQKLTGVISAQDETDARQQLHSMGLSVISISETNEEPTGIPSDQSIITFYFKVIDKKGKEMDGTIDSDSKKTAFRRLVGEYHFQVLLLCEASLPIEAREQKGKEGLDELASEIEDEYGITQVKDKRDDDETHEHSEEFLRKKAELLEEVNNVSKKAESIMEKYADKISGVDVYNVRNDLNNLMRIRLSNNLKHIKDLVEKLFLTIDDIIKQYGLNEELPDLSFSNEKGENVKSANSDQLYQENLEATGVVANVKAFSERLTGFLTGKYRKSKRRKKGTIEEYNASKKKAKNKEGQWSFAISRIIRYAKKALTSKSKVERQESINELKKTWNNFKKARQERLIAKKTGILEEGPVELDSLTSKHVQRPETESSLFFREARLFTGWLIAFYIVYFFIAFYTKFKWGEASPLYSFVEKSLNTSFLYAFAGVLFFAFLAFSLKVKYAKSNILKSLAVFISTFFLMIVFLLNF